MNLDKSGDMEKGDWKKCDVCGRRFIEVHEFKQHLNSHYDNDAAKSDDSGKSVCRYAQVEATGNDELVLPSNAKKKTRVQHQEHTGLQDIHPPSRAGTESSTNSANITSGEKMINLGTNSCSGKRNLVLKKINKSDRRNIRPRTLSVLHSQTSKTGMAGLATMTDKRLLSQRPSLKTESVCHKNTSITDSVKHNLATRNWENQESDVIRTSKRHSTTQDEDSDTRALKYGRSVKCDLCGTQFDNEMNLTGHLKMHVMNADPNTSESASTLCKDCSTNECVNGKSLCGLKVKVDAGNELLKLNACNRALRNRKKAEGEVIQRKQNSDDAKDRVSGGVVADVSSVKNERLNVVKRLCKDVRVVIKDLRMHSAKPLNLSKGQSSVSELGNKIECQQHNGSNIRKQPSKELRVVIEDFLKCDGTYHMNSIKGANVREINGVEKRSCRKKTGSVGTQVQQPRGLRVRRKGLQGAEICSDKIETSQKDANSSTQRVHRVKEAGTVTSRTGLKNYDKLSQLSASVHSAADGADVLNKENSGRYGSNKLQTKDVTLKVIEKKWKCIICGRRFQEMNCLIEHLDFHGIGYSDTIAALSTKSQVFSTIVESSGNSIADDDAMATISSETHVDKEKIDGDDGRCHKCEYCGRRFRRYVTLIKHVALHEVSQHLATENSDQGLAPSANKEENESTVVANEVDSNDYAEKNHTSPFKTSISTTSIYDERSDCESNINAACHVTQDEVDKESHVALEYLINSNESQKNVPDKDSKNEDVAVCNFAANVSGESLMQLDQAQNADIKPDDIHDDTMHKGSEVQTRLAKLETSEVTQIQCNNSNIDVMMGHDSVSNSLQPMPSDPTCGQTNFAVLKITDDVNQDSCAEVKDSEMVVDDNKAFLSNLVPAMQILSPQTMQLSYEEQTSIVTEESDQQNFIPMASSSEVSLQSAWEKAKAFGAPWQSQPQKTSEISSSCSTAQVCTQTLGANCVGNDFTSIPSNDRMPVIQPTELPSHRMSFCGTDDAMRSVTSSDVSHCSYAKYTPSMQESPNMQQPSEPYSAQPSSNFQNRLPNTPRGGQYVAFHANRYAAPANNAVYPECFQSRFRIQNTVNVRPYPIALTRVTTMLPHSQFSGNDPFVRWDSPVNQTDMWLRQHSSTNSQIFGQRPGCLQYGLPTDQLGCTHLIHEQFQSQNSTRPYFSSHLLSSMAAEHNLGQQRFSSSLSTLGHQQFSIPPTNMYPRFPGNKGPVVPQRHPLAGQSVLHKSESLAVHNSSCQFAANQHSLQQSCLGTQYGYGAHQWPITNQGVLQETSTISLQSQCGVASNYTSQLPTNNMDSVKPYGVFASQSQQLPDAPLYSSGKNSEPYAGVDGYINRQQRSGIFSNYNLASIQSVQPSFFQPSNFDSALAEAPDDKISSMQGLFEDSIEISSSCSDVELVQHSISQPVNFDSASATRQDDKHEEISSKQDLFEDSVEISSNFSNATATIESFELEFSQPSNSDCEVYQSAQHCDEISSPHDMFEDIENSPFTEVAHLHNLSSCSIDMCRQQSTDFTQINFTEVNHEQSQYCDLQPTRPQNIAAEGDSTDIHVESTGNSHVLHELEHSENIQETEPADSDFEVLISDESGSETPVPCIDAKTTNKDIEPDVCTFEEMQNPKTVARTELIKKPSKGSEKGMTNQVSYDYHLKTHATKKSHKCYFCDKEFCNSPRLVKHLRESHPEEGFIFKCDICSKGFKLSISLIKHMKLAHQVALPPDEAETHTMKFVSVNGKWPCSVCCEVFDNMKQVIGHLPVHSRNKQLPVKQHDCKDSPAVPGTEVGSKVVGCQIKDDHNDNMRVRAREKPHKCDICGRRFACQTTLKRHHQAHNQQKHYECSVCKCKFHWETHFKNHMKTHKRSFSEIGASDLKEGHQHSVVPESNRGVNTDNTKKDLITRNLQTWDQLEHQSVEVKENNKVIQQTDTTPCNQKATVEDIGNTFDIAALTRISLGVHGTCDNAAGEASEIDDQQDYDNEPNGQEDLSNSECSDDIQNLSQQHPSQQTMLNGHNEATDGREGIFSGNANYLNLDVGGHEDAKTESKAKQQGQNDLGHKEELCHSPLEEKSAMAGRDNKISSDIQTSNLRKKRKREYTCQTCKKIYVHLGHYKAHIRSHETLKTGNLMPEYQCEICESYLSSLGRLRHHFQVVHQQNRNLEDLQKSVKPIYEEEHVHSCPMCGGNFAILMDLLLHIKAHEEDGRAVLATKKTSKLKDGWTCHICGKGFVYLTSLDKHVRRHNANRSFKCELCGTRLRSQRGLRKHKRIHSANKPFLCDICGKRFRHKSSLKWHVMAHKGEAPFECTICHKKFRGSAFLKCHMKEHDTQFQCEVCGQKRKSLDLLKRHRVRAHGEKQYVCDKCGKKFSFEGNLKKHLRSCERGYSCEKCGKKYKRMDMLTMHMLVHTGKQKEYACDFCDFSFDTKFLLDRHRMTHTGEKPYKCQYCSKAFNQSFFLKTHLKTHKIMLKWFICQTCGESFEFRKDLRKHEAESHAQEKTEEESDSDESVKLNDDTEEDGKESATSDSEED